jgi:ribonuclease HIII
VRQEIWPIIGVDESGKGDFFGPLVVAGVLISEEELSVLATYHVRDSKKIASKRLKLIAAEIRRRFEYELVVINPEKYNELYRKIGNLNQLLGWGHARVIENILKRRQAPAAVSDKFGHERYIMNNLQKMGKSIEIIQEVRAEAHPAVAAASILARAEFLRRMDSLSESIGLRLPRGASHSVDKAGQQLIRDRGCEVLRQVAKIHFKNYRRITTNAII